VTPGSAGDGDREPLGRGDAVVADGKTTSRAVLAGSLMRWVAT
jgi:hypothetical protein